MSVFFAQCALILDNISAFLDLFDGLKPLHQRNEYQFVSLVVLDITVVCCLGTCTFDGL